MRSNEYYKLYAHIAYLQQYLTEIMQNQRTDFQLDDNDLQLIVACLRIIKEEIEQ